MFTGIGKKRVYGVPSLCVKRLRTSHIGKKVRSYKYRKSGGGGYGIGEGTAMLRRPQTVIFHSLAYLPNEYHNIMRYSEDWVDTTAGGIRDLVYSQNHIYDPYVGAGGQVVNGWSTMTQLYQRYKVTYSKVKVTGVNLDTDDPITLTILPNDASAGLSSTYDTSKPEARSIVISNQSGQGILVHGCSTKRSVGPIYKDSDLACSGTGGPTCPLYWHIIVRNVSAQALNMYMKVDIDYYVTWFGRCESVA